MWFVLPIQVVMSTMRALVGSQRGKDSIHSHLLNIYLNQIIEGTRQGRKIIQEIAIFNAELRSEANLRSRDSMVTTEELEGLKSSSLQEHKQPQ